MVDVRHLPAGMSATLVPSCSRVVAHYLLVSSLGNGRLRASKRRRAIHSPRAAPMIEGRTMSTAKVKSDTAQQMKLFRLPNGLEVWNAPQSGAEINAFY